MLALGGALLLALTLMPVLCSFVLTGKVHEGDNFVIAFMKKLYRPTLDIALRLRWLVVVASVVLFAGSLWLFTRLGAEFAPLDGSTTHALQARGHEHGRIAPHRHRGRNTAACGVPRSHPHLFPHRHERHRHRPDAAQRERRLYLHAARRMAQDAGPPAHQKRS
jgi:hypothetical protein